MAAAAQLVIAYDGSPSAINAVRVADALFAGARAAIVTVPSAPPSSAFGASRFLVNVPSGTLEQALEEIVAEVTEEARGVAEEGVKRAAALDAAALVTQPPHGPTWEALLAAAGEAGADVLVCGARDRGEFARTVLGSTSTSLLHHAKLPVVVVPDDAEPSDGPVLIAYDGSEAADRAIDVAGRLLPGRAAVVVHVYVSQYRDSRAVRVIAQGEVGEIVKALDQALTDEATEITTRGVERARAAGLDAQGETIQADKGVWRTITALARDRHAALVVTGSRGLGGARSVLLGSVSSGLVHNAEVPVLVAHA